MSILTALHGRLAPRPRLFVTAVAAASLATALLIPADTAANAAAADPTAGLTALAAVAQPCDYLKPDPNALILTDASGKTFLNDPFNLKTRLTVDVPGASQDAAVDANGQITLTGTQSILATFLDASVGRATTTTATISPTGDLRILLHRWTAKLRPAKLGKQDLCVRTQFTDLVRGHVFRPVTVVDKIAPAGVRGLTISGISQSGASATWDAATDNYGLSGYEITVDGTARRVSGRTYKITGLNPSTSHTVSVVAIDLAGNRSATPATKTFTTDAIPPPPPPPNPTTPPSTGSITVDAQQGSAIATWTPGTTDDSYTVYVNGVQGESFSVLSYCVDANGNVADPCTSTSRITYPIDSLDSDTAYTLRVDASPANGGAATTRSATFQTPDVTPVVPEATAQQIVSESQQCAGAGGSIYLSPGQRGSITLPSGATALSGPGCYRAADSSCVDRVLPPTEDGKINCSDDVTKLVRALAPPGKGPSIDNLRGSGPRALAPRAVCLAGGCVTALVAAEEAVATTTIMQAAGLTVATVAAVAGAIIVAVVFFSALQIAFAEPIAIAGLLEYPIKYTDDFRTYDTWTENKAQYYNSLQIYAQTITATKEFNQPGFAWNTQEDTNLKWQIDQACNAQKNLRPDTATGCDDGLVVYVPGGTNAYGKPMQQTGKHIAETIPAQIRLDHPERVPWYYPGYSKGGQKAISAGFRRNWFDTSPFNTQMGNPCRTRLRSASACDEFPFWTTDQAVTLSGTQASLKPVPSFESSAQGNDLSGFYSKCKVNDGDRFLVIPVAGWINASGPSFAFRLDRNSTSLCHGPGIGG